MDIQQEQLNLEVELLLTQLLVPTPKAILGSLATQKNELLALKQRIQNLPPEVSQSLLNDILSVSRYPHQVVLFNDQNTKRIVNTHVGMGHLYALTLAFLSNPLKKDIPVNALKNNQATILDFTKKEYLSPKEGIEFMILVLNMTKSLIQILETYALECPIPESSFQKN